MARKPDPQPDDPEQSQRFRDLAKEIGADADEQALADSLRRIAAHPREPRRKVGRAAKQTAKAGKSD